MHALAPRIIRRAGAKRLLEFEPPLFLLRGLVSTASTKFSRHSSKAVVPFVRPFTRHLASSLASAAACAAFWLA
jgi:hypothetical protein